MQYTGAACTDLLSSILLPLLALLEYRCLVGSPFRNVILSISGFHIFFALCSLGGAVAWTNGDFTQPYNSTLIVWVMIFMGAQGIALVPAGVLLLQHHFRLDINRGAWTYLPAALGLLHAAFQICMPSQYFWSRAVASGFAGAGMCWLGFVSLVCLWAKPTHDRTRTSSHRGTSSSMSIGSDDVRLPARCLLTFICSTTLAMLGCALMLLEGDACNDWSVCKFGDGPWPFCHNALLPQQCPFNEHFNEYVILHITWLLAAAGYFGCCCILHRESCSVARNDYTVLHAN